MGCGCCYPDDTCCCGCVEFLVGLVRSDLNCSMGVSYLIMAFP